MNKITNKNKYLIICLNIYMSNLFQSKAIRYYLLDLCNNLERFDSWAAMALARGSQIETKLNSVSYLSVLKLACKCICKICDKLPGCV